MNEKTQSDHAPLEKEIRIEVSKKIQEYLTQKPQPPLISIADFFGVYDVLKSDKKSGGTILHVPDLVNALVDRILSKKLEADESISKLVEIEFVDQTLVPPGEGEIIPGSGEGIEERETIPRSEYLIDLLRENDIAFEKPVVGRNTSNMMRGDHSYFMFYLPEFERSILVNNQEGNATYIFYDVNSKEDAFLITKLRKAEYKDSAKNMHPYLSKIWMGDKENWQEKILDSLTGRVPRRETKVIEEKTKEKKNRKYSEESVLQSLKEAYEKWSRLDREEYSVLNPTWLGKNGYGGQYEWILNNGGIEKFMDKLPQEIKDVFKKREVSEPKTEESVLQSLKEAYEKWSRLEPAERGDFNTTWLINNGFKEPYKWANKNGGIQKNINKLPQKIKDAFKKREVGKPENEESVLQAFKEAYEKWSRLDPSERGEFNPTWLSENGFKKQYRWAYIHGGIQEFMDKLPQEIKVVFKKKELSKPETEESVLQALKEAYEKWSRLDPSERGYINTAWLEKNGFKKPYKWTIRKGGIQVYIDKLTQEIRDAFRIKKYKRKK